MASTFEELVKVNAGVKFPATQAASSNVNTLDDYEEGTWIPIIGGSAGQSGQTYTAQTGLYVKIGKVVFVTFRVVLSAKGTINNIVRIKDLPFATQSETIYGPGSIGYYTALATTWHSVFMYNNNPGGTDIELCGVGAAASAPTSFVSADITNTTELNGSFMYFAQT